MKNRLNHKNEAIWIDLGNSPHVPFFLALSEEFIARGYEILWTVRDYAQTVEMSRNAGLDATIIGTHGGKNLFGKVTKFAHRTWELSKWARGKKIDLVVSHNSLEPLATARLHRIRSVNLMDYEHHPNNHVSFRLANKVIVPLSFPAENLLRFGASDDKVGRYSGIKEDVYLASFCPDPGFSSVLTEMGVFPDDILIVVRPHAPEALYNRSFENELLDQALDRFASVENVKIILLPRTLSQGEELRARHRQSNIIIPNQAVDGANLIASADLVVSGGGTMNREAAALGVPTATIFTGHSAAIDNYLCKEGRMKRIASIDDIKTIDLVKKNVLDLRGRIEARQEVADLILEK